MVNRLAPPQKGHKNPYIISLLNFRISLNSDSSNSNKVYSYTFCLHASSHRPLLIAYPKVLSFSLHYCKTVPGKTSHFLLIKTANARKDLLTPIRTATVFTCYCEGRS